MLNRRRILLQGGGPDYSGAVAGDIFCSDGTIVTQADYAASGKTGVAVVLMNTPGEGKLRLIKYYKSIPAVTWGTSIVVVAGMADYATAAELANDTSDSRTNTDLMIAQYGTATTHVAGYARSLAYDGLPVGSFGVMSYSERLALEANIKAITIGFSAIGDTSGELVTSPIAMISAQSGRYAWMRSQSASFPITYSWSANLKIGANTSYVLWPVAIIEY